MNKEPTYNPHDLKTLIYHAQQLWLAIKFADCNCYERVHSIVILEEDWENIVKLNKTMAECIAEIKEESER